MMFAEKPENEDLKDDTQLSQEIPADKRNRRLEMNRIAAQRSRQRKKEKMLSLSEAVNRLTEENNRLNLENRCLVQTQTDQEQELARSSDNTMLMNRYISIMDLSLQCVTTQLLLAKGEQPSEEKIDLAAVQLTRAVAAMMEQMEMQKQGLQQQMQHRIHRQRLMQQRNQKTPSLQPPNKILGQPQTSTQHNNILQKLQMGANLTLGAGQQGAAQMFAPKPHGLVNPSPGKPSTLTPLLQMQKQLYANRMKTALSDSMPVGSLFGAMPQTNPNPPFAGLPGFGAGSVGGRSPSIAGMTAGLPRMSSPLMNNMKYMRGITGMGTGNGINDATSSLLEGMGGVGNPLSNLRAGLSNMRRMGTGMSTSPVGNISNAMAGFPGMVGPNLAGLKDMLSTPNTGKIPVPVGQNLFQQSVFNHVRQKLQIQQQQQKQRQRKFQSTVNPLSALSTPSLKRVKMDHLTLVKPSDLLPKSLSVDLTKGVPKLPTAVSPVSPSSDHNNPKLPQTKAPAKAADSQMDAASALTRMLDDKPTSAV